MKPEDLPNLYRSELDEANLRELIADLTALAKVEVRLKATARGHAEVGLVTLDAAEEALLSGRVRGAQFVYAHEGKCWSDTVMRTPSGFVVVRLEQLFAPPDGD